MTIEGVSAYPLHWPTGRVRTTTLRQRARFSLVDSFGARALTVPAALERLIPELERLGARDLVVSTNIPPGRDGLPLSERVRVLDPGAAVYFRTSKGEPHCLSCDRWDRVADNIAAIAHHVRAIRGMLRWGVGDVHQAFAGHRVIEGKAAWWRVLGFSGPPTAGELRARWRDLAFEHHPDRGGDPARMAEISEAYTRGLKEMGL